MKRIVLTLMSFALVSLTGCATFDTVGWIDLPDGTRLKAVKLEVETVFGTDITHTFVYRCPPKSALAGTQCAKEGEFGGASASFLKAAMHGAGAGAAIGAGIAVQDADRTSVNSAASAEGGKAKAVQKQGQVQGQFQVQEQNQRQRQPRTRYGGGD